MAPPDLEGTVIQQFLGLANHLNLSSGEPQFQDVQRDADAEQRDSRAEEDVAPPLFPGVQAGRDERPGLVPVSYTHLTLPTKA